MTTIGSVSPAQQAPTRTNETRLEAERERQAAQQAQAADAAREEARVETPRAPAPTAETRAPEGLEDQQAAAAPRGEAPPEAVETADARPAPPAEGPLEALPPAIATNLDVSAFFQSQAPDDAAVDAGAEDPSLDQFLTALFQEGTVDPILPGAGYEQIAAIYGLNG